MTKSQKFVASYSGGKDSMLALYRTIRQGHQPLGLITTYNTTQQRSWFHGIPRDLLQQVADCLGIPLFLIETDGSDYEAQFEATLTHLKAQGAQCCVFGDIDLAPHLKWGEDRCKNTGLSPSFPLWKEDRSTLVYDFIDSGFTTYLNVVNTTLLPPHFLGKVLTRPTAQAIAATGADICGENGEYHTFVTDGPLFKSKLQFSFGSPLTQGNYACLPLHSTL